MKVSCRTVYRGFYYWGFVRHVAQTFSSSSLFQFNEGPVFHHMLHLLKIFSSLSLLIVLLIFVLFPLFLSFSFLIFISSLYFHRNSLTLIYI